MEDVVLGNDFLNRSSSAQNIRARTDKWNFTELNSFYTAKEVITRMKRRPTEWEKSLPAIH
jgi:hypothetical protein